MHSLRVSPLSSKAADIKVINCSAGNELSVNIPASKTKIEEFKDSTCRDITLQELAKSVPKGWPREQEYCPEILHPYWTYRMHIPRKWKQANSAQSRKRPNPRTVALWTLCDQTHLNQKLAQVVNT